MPPMPGTPAQVAVSERLRQLAIRREAVEGPAVSRHRSGQIALCVVVGAARSATIDQVTTPTQGAAS
jgi:hypothetical protein